MPSATLNNSGPGSAIGQARKSHPPASFKIKGQGGIKGKDNTSLKRRLCSAVLISQVPTMFCYSQGMAPRCPRNLQNATAFPTPLLQPNSNKASSDAGADQPRLRKCCFRRLFQRLNSFSVAKAEGKTPPGLSRGS